MSSFYVDEVSIGKIAKFALGFSMGTNIYDHRLQQIFSKGTDTWHTSQALADAMLHAMCDSLVLHGSQWGQPKEATRFLPGYIDEIRLQKGFEEAENNILSLTVMYKSISCFCYQIDYPEVCPRLMAHLEQLMDVLPRVIVETSAEWDAAPWD